MSATRPRILLLGGNGQLGRALRAPLAAIGEVHVASRDGVLMDGGSGIAVDLERPDTLRTALMALAPEIVVNAAAWTAVDRAEDEPERAFAVNAEAPKALASACCDLGAWLLHYSTDYVFDGSATRPWREADAPHPLGVYGASKLAGEIAIRDSGARYSILRTAWVFAAHGQNFLRAMLKAAHAGNALRVVADQHGTPTSVDWIAEATCALLRHGEPGPGLWHLTAAGETTWHGFASEIISRAHAKGLLPEPVDVTPITSAEWPTRVARPHYSVLDSSLLMRALDLALPAWQAGVDRALEQLAHAD